jgi:hypothetical protein
VAIAESHTAQNDLAQAFAIFFADRSEFKMFEKTDSPSEKGPGFRLDAAAFHPRSFVEM